MNKKILAGLLFALVVVFARPAYALTADGFLNTIKTLQKEVYSLKIKLGANSLDALSNQDSPLVDAGALDVNINPDEPGLIVPDSIVVKTDDATRRANTLYLGMLNNSEVKLIQIQLAKLGYPMIIDGSFGPKMFDAVVRFQSEHSLPPNGYVDDSTKMQIQNAINMRANPVTSNSSSVNNSSPISNISISSNVKNIPVVVPTAPTIVTSGCKSSILPKITSKYTASKNILQSAGSGRLITSPSEASVSVNYLGRFMMKNNTSTNLEKIDSVVIQFNGTSPDTSFGNLYLKDNKGNVLNKISPVVSPNGLVVFSGLSYILNPGVSESFTITSDVLAGSVGRVFCEFLLAYDFTDLATGTSFANQPGLMINNIQIMPAVSPAGLSVSSAPAPSPAPAVSLGKSGPTVSLIATPVSVPFGGGASKLSWKSSGATSCSAPWTGSSALIGSQIISLVNSTKYTISCTDGKITNTATILVGVALPPAPTVVSMTMQNSTQTTVDFAFTGTSMSGFYGSNTTTANISDLTKITYDNKHPISAVITSPSSMIATFPISVGTGKRGVMVSGSLNPGGLSVIIASNLVKNTSSVNNLATTILDSNITDNASPVVVAVTPPNGAINASTTAHIFVSFSELVSTGSAAYMLDPYWYSANHQIYNHLTGIEQDEFYTPTFPANTLLNVGVYKANVYPQVNIYSWSFTTAPAITTPASTPSSIVLSTGTVNPVWGVVNVAIPTAGSTDYTGAITGYTATTADKIKFTVIDTGAATSTVTMNGNPYTSGSNYQVVPTTNLLTAVVTTTELGKTTAVRTFVITGPILGSGGLTYGVVMGSDGKKWLDRNLGATRVALSVDDYQAYGDLFQWGRGNDGHQLISHTSSTSANGVNGSTFTLSTTNTPGNNLFIKNTSNSGLGFIDWRNPQNNNLWQGVSGTNNVCPAGFRVPTISEFQTLITASSISNNTSAYNSALKFTGAGEREQSNASVGSNLYGGYGYYWSSSTGGSSNVSSMFMHFSPYGNLTTTPYSRHFGMSIRCIRN